MQLTPRYDGPPALRINVGGDPGEAVVRQRRRLGQVLASLDASQWGTPSRCEGWSVRDVIAHLVTTTQFFSISVASGQLGAPTRFLTTFDPVSSPAALVEQGRSAPPSAVLAQYDASVDQLAAALAGIEADGWDALAESPPGHVATSAVVTHALWDAWVHERDILLPLGMDQEIESDEVTLCLRYVAALGPAFLATTGSTRTGTLVVEATSPDVHAVIEAGPTVVVHNRDAPAGAPVLRGAAVDLIESLSFRAPLDHDLSPDDEWLLGGLAAVFDRG